MMKKTLLFYIITLLAIHMGFAQSSNGVRVSLVLEPNNNTLYQPNDSSVFIIRILNEGPNDLIAADRFRVNYSLTNASSQGEDFDTLIAVGSPTLAVGSSRSYVVDSNIRFNGADIYSICADLVNGTDLFPVNTEKFSGKCEVFTVNIEKVDLKVNQLYYAEGNIHFSLNERSNYLFEVFNITGKLVVRESVQNLDNHKMRLPTTTKGFYFLKATDQDGRSVTSKFVIN